MIKKSLQIFSVNLNCLFIIQDTYFVDSERDETIDDIQLWSEVYMLLHITRKCDF